MSLKRQKKFFSSGKTLDLRWRKFQLRRLLTAIELYEPKLYEAFDQDLKKSEFEVFVTEVGASKRSIRSALKNLDRWARPKRERTPFALFGSSAYTLYEPYGCVLIIGPFNYPFLTVIEPLVGAMMAGNTVMIKPSEQTPNVSEVLCEMLGFLFDPDYIEVVLGEVEVTEKLLEEDFDLIFFTGSPRVGRLIMEKAAKHLTPVILELGGKSPVIVLEDADVKLAARRIVWGRLLNAGQTCIAPDYCLVHESLKQRLIGEMIREIQTLYGEDAQLSPDYSRIVSNRHAQRLEKMIKAHRTDIAYGGRVEGRYVEPTLLDLNSAEGAAMEEEIFGPVLPVIAFQSPEEVYRIVRSYPKPLALYVFGRDENTVQGILTKLSSGGAMVNDVILHVGNENLPFGGVSHSGMGSYHGKYSMEAFSHKKPVVKTWLHTSELVLKAPYSERKLSVLRKFLR
ncbi:MAG: aldehyde dehydrogenase family protein [Filifactor alocis]|nr:aldehyde dehydrogenase family protein [Filifactor alocis]